MNLALGNFSNLLQSFAFFIFFSNYYDLSQHSLRKWDLIRSMWSKVCHTHISQSHPITFYNV